MTALTIAGRTVHDPLKVIGKYARKHSRTLKEYDFEPSGDPYTLTLDDVRSTRIIASRISEVEAAEIVRLATQAGRLWAAVPAEAELRDADPAKHGGLYDAMESLYASLQFRGVQHAKVSKVLHRKRRGAFPVLDATLMAVYRNAAAKQAARYPDRGYRRMYWAAIREDVIANEGGLEQLQSDIGRISDVDLPMHKLSNVRLLDIIAWSLANPNGSR